MAWYEFRPYVSVARRRAQAASEVAKLAKKGRRITPVRPDGRMIAHTFWGKAWCDNLEAYSDYANRMPRGRTYIRNGSVVDLQIAPGKVTALVSGSELYKIEIGIAPLPRKTWTAIKARCAGQIASVIELLRGKLSQGVMEIITKQDGGLFPAPTEIDLDCSCPDWADMCKHVAAALYGVGTRLDAQPELLFTLRQVDHLELIEQAGNAQAIAAAKAPEGGAAVKTIAAEQLADVFGIELDAANTAAAPAPASAAPVKRRAKAAAAKPAKPKRVRRHTIATPQTTGSGGSSAAAKAAEPVDVVPAGGTGRRKVRVVKVPVKHHAAPDASSEQLAGTGNAGRNPV